MPGKFMIPVSHEVRSAADVAGGDTLKVALDTAPRVLELPEDFAAALGVDRALCRDSANCGVRDWGSW